MSFSVNEASSFVLPLDVVDQDGTLLLSVSAIDWWVGSPRSKEPIIEKTSLTDPSSEEEITIPSEANICSQRRDENRFVIVRVERADGYVKHEVFPYTVKALDLVPYPS